MEDKSTEFLVRISHEIRNVSICALYAMTALVHVDSCMLIDSYSLDRESQLEHIGATGQVD